MSGKDVKFKVVYTITLEGISKYNSDLETQKNRTFREDMFEGMVRSLVRSNNAMIKTSKATLTVKKIK